MSTDLSYDYWKQYPEHDPQAFVWYPMSFGPLATEDVWPSQDRSIQAAGSSFYIHVPFCAVVCPFCPFNKYASSAEQMRRFVQAVKREISLLAARRGWCSAPMRAGYFGGGTPTALSAEGLAEILEHLQRELTFEKNAEITVEGSPETLTAEKLVVLRSLGVNRISFGVQSFEDRYLKMLGRGHDASQVFRAVEMVRAAGFNNLAIDLMYRLPGQTVAEWRKDLDVATSVGVDHISAYSLFVEPGSPLSRMERGGKLLPIPDDTIDLEMFRLCIDFLGERGFDLYTLYDFAQKGKKCDHHLVNWAAPQAEYVGIGPGAFSFVRNGEEEFVYGNINPLEPYFAALARDQLPIDFGVRLSQDERMARYMVIGFDAAPVPLQPFAERFGKRVEDVFSKEISQLVDWGLIDVNGSEIRLTRQGQLYQANVGKMFCTEKNRMIPHPAGVDLQKGGGLSTIAITNIGS